MIQNANASLGVRRFYRGRARMNDLGKFYMFPELRDLALSMP
jgi:hypothetical protein